jgi:hypothetical protein
VVRDTLEDFVDGSVASAGKEDVCGVGKCSGLMAGGIWAVGGNGSYFCLSLLKGFGDARDRGEAMMRSTGVGVVEQDDAHVGSVARHRWGVRTEGSILDS